MKSKFLKQWEDYQSFLLDLKNLIKDYCLLTNKYNPTKDYDLGDDLTFEIEKGNLYLSWEETEYYCGDNSINYEKLIIPLDFYENTKNIEIELAKKEENKKQIKEKINNLQKELNKINNIIISFNKDKKILEDLKIKYSFSFNIKDLEIKYNENIKTKDILLSQIEELKKEFDRL